ncbi:MAG: hypothetical protein ACRDWW_08665, partial [Acidimicrobiales bacterium]
MAQSLSRRQFLELAGSAAGFAVVAAACGSSTGGKAGATTPTSAGAAAAPAVTFVQPTTKLSGDLRILQWSHFVPAYDTWFDPFAKDWGTKAGV